MGEIVREIVQVHIVIVDEHTTVDVLRDEVEADVVPVGRPHLMIWRLSVTEVLGNGEGQGSGLKQGHLSLEVLIFASVILESTTVNTQSLYLPIDNGYERRYVQYA